MPTSISSGLMELARGCTHVLIINLIRCWYFSRCHFSSVFFSLPPCQFNHTPCFTELQLVLFVGSPPFHFIACSKAKTLSTPHSCSHYVPMPQSARYFPPGFLGWPDLTSCSSGPGDSVRILSVLALPALYASTTYDNGSVSFAVLLYNAALDSPDGTPVYLCGYWLTLLSIASTVVDGA